MSAKGGAVSAAGTVGQRAQELCDTGERADECQAGDTAAHQGQWRAASTGAQSAVQATRPPGKAVSITK